MSEVYEGGRHKSERWGSLSLSAVSLVVGIAAVGVSDWGFLSAEEMEK